ncbi:bacterioferritin [Hydrogenophilus thermoluteolus]|uniref:bacterioferritin n=1 Tax=Hydrogenophilus thermoluteolus TaxID=297 RepID=UPI000EC68035|nr:bacterioferritin [Hydrogenophilus thermoluteolus]MBW7657143.1 bacterioferritin [Hydrogenophilus thermoluteolus]HCO77641.1 bacterioferritin [Rhodocyclaceae bacterium]HNQ48039.1 bacterioferritin [Hydrogenophilus thermoluteolus]HNU19029.1 bacterioferritin [Hydrogenophilus thermoluteolus]
MKGDPKVLQLLNDALKNELTAVNQYFLHARMYQNWGYHALAEVEYRESIEEMKHADRLIQRILFLEGLPNLQDLGRLRIGENVPECLKADRALEEAAIAQLRGAIAYCESVRDFVSRDLLSDLLDDSEEHYDWADTQLELIESLGLQNYLQSAMGKVDS